MTINPIFAFVGIWLFVLLLYSLELSLVLDKLNDFMLLYLLLTMVVMLLAVGFYRVICAQKKHVEHFDKYLLCDSRKKLSLFFIAWMSFSVLELSVFQSLPIISGSYADWGIPSLHGLANAILLVMSNYLIYLYISTGKKRYLLFFFCLLLWPVLLFTRQLFISMVIQAVLVFVTFKRISMKAVLSVLLIAMLTITVFGVIGDQRSSGGGDAFVTLVQPSESYPDFLPSGFLWVYIYVTSPLNNISYNIESFDELEFSPTHIMSSLLPSFIRHQVFGESEKLVELPVENLNVSTFFPSYLAAFGVWGSLIYFFFAALITMFFFHKAKYSGNVKWSFINIVIIHNIVFSMFVDFFTSLVFLYQMFLHYYIGTKLIYGTQKKHD